jgi:hypothetical protein
MDYFLDGVMEHIFYLGLSFDYIKADGIEETPLTFTLHDVLHAKGYFSYITSFETDESQLKSFYEFVKKNKDAYGRKKFYHIKFFLFLQLHEIGIIFFIGPDDSLPDYNESIYDEIIEHIPVLYSRLSDLDNLGGLMPKRIQEMKGFLNNKKEEIKKFVNESFISYIEALNEWIESERLKQTQPQETPVCVGNSFCTISGGKKTKRSKRSKRTKRSKKSKKNKSRKTKRHA